MEFIQFLKEEEYQVANLNGEGKAPGIRGWNTEPELFDKCNLTKDKFFIRTGEQGGYNEDHIIGLDFDVYKKRCKENKHQETFKLLEEFKEANKEKHGMFQSATAFNEGCIVSIKGCVELISMLEDIGKTKFENKGCHLELLNGSAFTLPPTATKCKMTGRLTKRQLYTPEHPILQLKRNTPPHKFILKYVKKYWQKKYSGLSDSDKRRLNKKAKEIYTTWKNGKYGEEIEKNPEHGVDLLSKLRDDRYEYHNWWKIGTALLNSFPKEVATTLFLNWSRKDPNFESDNNVLEKLEEFDKVKERYNGLNICWIFRLIECDNKNAFLPCIQEYKNIAQSTIKKSFNEEFEDKYKFCKNPQGFFHKTRGDEWILKQSYQVSELEAHNAVLLDEWKKNPNRQMFEYADCIPVKQHEDASVLNVFTGFNFWKWGEMSEWEDEWIKKQQKYQCSNEENTLLHQVEEWWQKYIHVISGGSEEIGTYIKCLLGRSLFDPTILSKVMICFQGKEGAGKSFLKNILDALIGGKAVHSETNPDKGNSVFGSFQEPLLYATQVFLEENDPKKLNGIINDLKDKITIDRYSVNTKGKDLIHRLNCIQFWASSNDLSTINFSTTVRRFLAIKVLPDLIKGLVDKLDEYWLEKYQYKFWNFGYDMVLKNEFCLKYLVMDIYDTYENEGGSEIDFQKTMPECDHMKHAIKLNIKPIYPFLQKIATEALETCEDYENSKTTKTFDYWYFREEKPNTFLKPLSSKLAQKKNFVGGWKIGNKEFRRELDEYCSNTLDRNGVSYETKDIVMYLTDLLGADGVNFKTQTIRNKVCYLLKPKEIINKLKIFNFYQEEFQTTGEEAWEEEYDWGEEDELSE